MKISSFWKAAGTRLGASVVGWTVSASALAWGVEGHRLIAERAEKQLSPAAKAEVYRLLKQEPGATLASVSTWADETRRPGSAAFHYVNLPEGECTYVRQRDCPDGRCVVEAIAENVALLKSSASDSERLLALKWIVHLVGDVHQPLHVGLARDKGGNLFQIRAFGRGSNLHRVWDVELLRLHRDQTDQELDVADGKGEKQEIAFPEPARWATESCDIRSSDWFYPTDRRVEQNYAVRWHGVLADRLKVAAQRLAATINFCFR